MARGIGWRGVVYYSALDKCGHQIIVAIADGGVKLFNSSEAALFGTLKPRIRDILQVGVSHMCMVYNTRSAIR